MLRPPNPFHPVSVPGSAVGPARAFGSVLDVGSLLVELVEDTVVLDVVVVVPVLVGGGLDLELELVEETVVVDDVEVVVPVDLLLTGCHLFVRQ